MFAFFGHHKCATMSLNTILGCTCRRIGLRHAALFNSGQFDGDLAGYCDEHKIDFLLYGNANMNYVKNMPPHRGIHIIRDPRDIVVSAYFSHLHSHPTHAWPELKAHREKLGSMSQEEGLAEEIKFRNKSFRHMAVWDYAQDHVLEIRFESFIKSSYEILLAAFQHMSLVDESRLGYRNRFRNTVREVLASLRRRSGCNLLPYRPGRQIHASELLALNWQHRFEARSKGRSQGDEDVRNHYRKGRSGDWTNYFTPELKQAFKNNYPGLVPQLGYAPSDDW